MNDPLDTIRVIDRKQLREKVPYSTQHLSRLEKRGQFPKRVALGLNRVGWLESEVNQWIDSKLSMRGVGTALVPAAKSVGHK